MSKITLESLRLQNFKGHRDISIQFDSHNAAVYGDNATGKSSLYDGLTWLLFGHDSHGQSTFDIKPLGADGQVKDHGAVTTVEAVLRVNGDLVTVCKTYFEKWATRRGNAEKVFDGHSSEFFIDGVPMKKSAFEGAVAELIPYDRFMMLSITDYFCATMPWKKRREALFSLCDIPADGVLLSTLGDGFGALQTAMGRGTMDDLKSKLTAQRKGLVGAQNSIPARMDECQRTVTDISGMDFAPLKQKRLDLEAALELVTARRIQCQQGTLANTYRNTIGELENQLQALNNANESFKNVQKAKEKPDLRFQLENKVAMCKGKLDELERASHREHEYIELLEKDIQALRDKWHATNDMTFDPQNCPTCGQALPQAAQEEAKHKFEGHKQMELVVLVGQSADKKNALAAAKERYNQALSAIQDADIDLRHGYLDLENYVPPFPGERVDMPGFFEKAECIREDLRDVNIRLDALRQEESATIRQLMEEEYTLRKDCDAVDKDLALEGHLMFANNRLDQLRQEAKAAAQELADVDALLFAIEDFTRQKVGYISESINSKFSLVNFKLFKEQVNGGLDECCDVTVDGVPYQSLNTGARINAGLDVIRTLSKHHGDSVPLFVDNAEAVTRLIEMDTQVIRLVVDANYKTLEVEGEQ